MTAFNANPAGEVGSSAVPRLAIAFVTTHGEGAIRARLGLRTDLAFGGAEQQIALLATGLAHRGHKVAVICALRPGAGEEERLEGIHLLRIRVGDAAGGRIQRALRDALDHAGARLVYQRCALPLTGRLAWLCARSGRRFIFAVANDRDLDGRVRGSLGAVRHALYRYGLRRADLVVVQTRQQEAMLAGRRRHPSLLLPSALDLEGVRPRPEPASPVVLWVGNLLPKKRPMELLDLAAKLPGVAFHAVGDPGLDRNLAEQFAARAGTLPNVRYLGRVEHAGMDALYARATLLLNTSEAEGVPNTFLEAWARGVPVVSLRVDPDGLIAREGLGLVVGDQDPAVTLSGYLEDTAGRGAAGQRARAHVLQAHDLHQVVARFESALAAL